MSKFNNIGEVLKDEKCAYFLDKQITATKYYRSIVPIGTRFKRNSVDYLEENGLFNAKELINQYVGIIGKKTELPSKVRQMVVAMVRESITETIKFYEKTETDAI